MNRVMASIAPAIDAFTSMYSPARNAVKAMTSSVRLPRVALSNPPTASPVLAAADSVARLSSAAREYDCQDGQYEEQRVRSGPELFGGEYPRYQHQQPEQRVVTDFFKEEAHEHTSAWPFFLSGRIDVISVARPLRLRRSGPIASPATACPQIRSVS